MMWIRKKVAVAGDNYSWASRWKFQGTDSDPYTTGTLGSSEGFDTGSVTYTDNVEAPNNTHAGMVSNKLQLHGDNGLGLNECYAYDGTHTTYLYMGCFMRGVDLSAADGDVDYCMSYSNLNSHARPPGITFENSNYFSANVSGSMRYNHAGLPTDTYDIMMVMGDTDSAGTSHWVSGDTDNDYRNGVFAFIESRTGTDFSQVKLLFYYQKCWAVIQSNIYMLLGNRINTNSVDVDIDACGLVDGSTDTFKTMITNNSEVDRFTEGTDGVDLVDHTSDRGSISWTGTSFDIQSNQAVATNSSGITYYNCGDSNPCIHVSVTTHATKTDEGGIVFRHGDSSNYWYLSIQVGTGFGLKRVVSGTPTTVVTPTGTCSASTTYSLLVYPMDTDHYEVVLDNSRLFGYTTNDTNLSSNTNVGLYDSATSNLTFDNWFRINSTSTDYDTVMNNAMADLA